jgi:hypothetical protein
MPKHVGVKKDRIILNDNWSICWFLLSLIYISNSMQTSPVRGQLIHAELQTGRQTLPTQYSLFAPKNLSVLSTHFNLPYYSYDVNIPSVFGLFVCFWRDSPQCARASSNTRFLDHTQQRTTFSRTYLDEWSARRRDLPDNTKHSQ